MGLVKKILPIRLFSALVVFRDTVNYFLLVIIKSSKFFSWLAMILSPHFLLEYNNFAKAAYKYEASVKGNRINLYFLRRNIHRIEKGLTMKPLRSEFALRFILSTVNSFCYSLKVHEFKMGSEYKWALGVLSQYFKVTSSSDFRYVRARRQFFDVIDAEESEKELTEVPLLYGREALGEHFNALKDLLIQRKSVRRFEDKPINRELINQALELAALSPSSCNRQPYCYEVIMDETLAPKVAAIPAGTAGWSNNVKCLAVLIGDLSAFSNVANRHSIYVDASLSVMPFVLALEAKGLSTCIINWADNPKKDKAMQKVLGLKDHEKVVLSIAIGYAESDLMVPYSKRKKTNEISKYVG